jgi:antitoxin VapB
MAFNVKNDEADRLLRELTALTGESLTDAITESLRERLARERRVRCLHVGDPLTQAIEQLRGLPVIDHRSADEIVGYDEHGLPT